MSNAPHSPASAAGPVYSRFRFASRRVAIDAVGVRSRVTDAQDNGLAGAAAGAIEGLAEGDLLVGALPFKTNAPAELFVPERVRVEDPTVLHVGLRTPAAAGLREAHYVPTREQYRQAVRGALEAMQVTAESSAPLDKVVLARTLRLVFPGAIDIDRVFENLRRDPAATAFQVTRRDGDTSFLGGSPELLVERLGDRVTSLPMAGSVPRAPVASADNDVASNLLRSFKDHREHQFVVESVLDALAPFCRELNAPTTPELTSTATMWHLATPVVGRLRHDRSSLELALALHPTPAVCGTPRAAARETIGALEPFDRGLFAGTVGWCDRRGDGQWMVSIRCAEVRGPEARLFAGAGIVPGSDPAAEADETEAKFGTFLRALGLSTSDALAADVRQAGSRVCTST